VEDRSEKKTRKLTRRQVLLAGGGAVIAGSVGSMGFLRFTSDQPVKVGILHSLSGTMSVSETALRDAAVLAVEEINRSGGIFGRTVQTVVEDASSNNARFAQKAEKLLRDDKVCSIFGCWTSASRKAVLPVLEHYNGLLWYPVQYEGNECSRNVVYTGSTPNQQIVPAIDWLYRAGRRRFFLVGSDYVFPRTANVIVKDHLRRLGGSVVGEEYVALGSDDFEDTVEKIRRVKPDAVLSTVNGYSNRAFYHYFRKAGISAAVTPIMAVSLAEEEVRIIGTRLTQGHLAAWAYFQSVDTAENRSFVDKFKERYGDLRVTSDPVEAAYFQVHLWAQAVRKAGTFSTDAIRAHAAGLRLDAPEGPVSIDLQNRHTWKMFRIGEVQSDGQFRVLHSSDSPIRPEPWDRALHSGKDCDWESGK
jgi:urea transport system substrate-binding protein